MGSNVVTVTVAIGPATVVALSDPAVVIGTVEGAELVVDGVEVIVGELVTAGREVGSVSDTEAVVGGDATGVLALLHAPAVSISANGSIVMAIPAPRPAGLAVVILKIPVTATLPLKIPRTVADMA